MSFHRRSETAFETVLEAHLLLNGYVSIKREGFDRGRAIFPETVLAFLRETQPKAWGQAGILTRRQNRRAGASVTCASGWTPTARSRR